MSKRIFFCVIICIAALVFFACKKSSKDTPAYEPQAVEILKIDFEDGQMPNIQPRYDRVRLTVTNEDAFSGEKSLLVSGRAETYHGIDLRIDQLVEPDTFYDVYMQVRAKSADFLLFGLTKQAGVWPNAEYLVISYETTVNKNGWTQIRGRFSYTAEEIAKASGFISVYFECPDPRAEIYIDDISLVKSPSTDNLAATARLPSLGEIYKDHFLLGFTFMPAESNNLYLPFFKRHASAMYPANEFKPEKFTKASGVYDFTAADRAIAFAESAGAKFHGHTLLWHEQSADWLNKNPDGTPLTRAQAKANLESYINTVVKRYAGRVYSYDVVNEAMRDFYGRNYGGNWKNELRSTGSNAYSHDYAAPWYLAYANGAGTGESGADYIYDAFVLTRLADPAAKLIYNEYGLDNQNKAAATADMIRDINNKWKTDQRNREPARLLIEGVGEQGHYDFQTNINNIERTLKRFVDLGVSVSISELDFIVFANEDEKKGLIPTENLLRRQAEFYARLFRLFKQYSDNIDRVNICGVDDLYSWLKWGYPLLFDADFIPKSAYFAVADPEGYLAGRYDNPGEILSIDFEDGTLNNIQPRGDTRLSVTEEMPATGKKSLLVSNRSENWQGINLRINQLVEPGALYDISVKVRLKSANAINADLGLQIGEWPDDQYRDVTFRGREEINKNFWTRYKARLSFTAQEIAKGLTIFVSCSDPTADFYIDDITFVKLQTGNEEGGVLISFDDYTPELWEPYFDLFDRYGAKVTFFVNGDKPTDFMARAQKRGHEIGFHSISHPHLPQISRNDFDKETISVIDGFKRGKIDLTTFAYPFADYDPWMNGELLKHYKVVRGMGAFIPAYTSMEMRRGFVDAACVDFICTNSI
uniref:Endo-1,4-beta-xylanase n=1 Tax=uncultured bacterium contig00142 TaxID=1181584 RepID=A0A806KIB2_9BACT|nr:endo-1,4-beta-xylanase [uncultured bacterium contig00142]